MGFTPRPAQARRFAGSPAPQREAWRGRSRRAPGPRSPPKRAGSGGRAQRRSQALPWPLFGSAAGAVKQLASSPCQCMHCMRFRALIRCASIILPGDDAWRLTELSNVVAYAGRHSLKRIDNMSRAQAFSGHAHPATNVSASSVSRRPKAAALTALTAVTPFPRLSSADPSVLVSNLWKG
jgi:hypothetical protein